MAPMMASGPHERYAPVKFKKLRADEVEIGHVVMSGAILRRVCRTSFSTDGAWVKLQYSDDSRDWWPIEQGVFRQVVGSEGE